jgi:hypothetical protein
VDFSRVLDALVTRGFVVKYRVDGVDYGCIPTFTKHQVINNRESASTIPEPTENNNTSTREARVEHASPTPLVQDQGEGKGREGKEYSTVAKATRTREKYSDEFEKQFWVPYPRTPTMSKQEAWKSWEKLSPDDRLKACEAIDPYRQFLKTKPNLETVHTCRFISQRRFEGFSDVPPPTQIFDIRSHIA